MHETSVQGWCTRMTQRDGEGGGRGGSGWGTHVNPWLIHVYVWQKPLQYCKVISLQLIKINEKKSFHLVNLAYPKKSIYIILVNPYNREKRYMQKVKISSFMKWKQRGRYQSKQQHVTFQKEITSLKI